MALLSEVPNLELNAIQDQIKDSQTHFYALDLKSKKFDLKNYNEETFIQKLSIKEAEEDAI